MQRDRAPFSADRQRLWRMAEPSIWSLTEGRPEEVPATSIMRIFLGSAALVETHLYDDRGSELFEQICELPEYYLTRTEEAILERAAGDIIAAAPVE